MTSCKNTKNSKTTTKPEPQSSQQFDEFRKEVRCCYFRPLQEKKGIHPGLKANQKDEDLEAAADC